ncbi:radical SAM protein [bacterium]|nr:radical SAM protein [bacterium]
MVDLIDVKQFSSDKILAHLDRINEWLKTGITCPITFELDMTNICNHRCPWCFGFYDRDNKDNITLQEAKEIIYQIKEFGGRGLTFTGGGEPLCNPATPEAIQYAKSIGLDIGFITNGSILNEQIAKILVENCVWIRISLDAASPTMFKKTHGMSRKAFDKVIENIKLLVKEKKRLNSKSTIGAGYLTSPETKKEIYEFALLCRDLKIDYAQFRPLLIGFGNNQVDYSRKVQRGIIKEIEKSLKLSKNGFQVLYSKHKYDCMKNGETFRSYGKCFGHHFATVICADKKMYICCHFRGVKKYSIGDLSKNTLKEIWHSEARKKVYENINLKGCIPLCRCNTFNTILWNIKQEKVHKNFI